MTRAFDKETNPILVGRWEMVKVVELGSRNTYRTPANRKAGKWYVQDCLGSQRINGAEYGEYDTLRECFVAIKEPYPSQVTIENVSGLLSGDLEQLLVI
jgi:hypothetical protein